MKYTPSFVLGLIGSILGLLGIVCYVAINIYILFVGSFWNFKMEPVAPSPPFVLLLLFSLLPFLSLSFFIVSLIKCLPRNLENYPRKNGLWLLWIGIGTGIVSGIINPLTLIPSILLIIAGVLAIVKSKKI